MTASIAVNTPDLVNALIVGVVGAGSLGFKVANGTASGYLSFTNINGSQSALASLAHTANVIAAGTASFGAWATTPTPDPQGSPLQTGYSCTVIARANFVPNQTVDADFYITMSGYHLADYAALGCNHIDFMIDGGAATTVTSQTLNPDTTWPTTTPVPEYAGKVQVADHTPGPHECRTITYPSVGGCLVTEGINFYVAGGTSQYQTVYTSMALSSDTPPGNDSSAVASTTLVTAQANPCLTPAKAMALTKAYRLAHFGLDDVDGGECHLTPGLHALAWLNYSDRTATARYFTFRPEDGHDKTDTGFNNWDGLGGPECQFICFRNLSMSVFVGGNAGIYQTTARCWLDNCGCSGIFVDAGWLDVIWTGNEIHNTLYGCLGPNTSSLIKANYIHDIRGDVSRNGQWIIGNKVDNVNPYNVVASTNSSTSVAIASGYVTITLDADIGLNNVQEFEAILIQNDADHLMIGYLDGAADRDPTTHWNSATKVLTVNTNNAGNFTCTKGSGTFSSWTVSLLGAEHADVWQWFGQNADPTMNNNTAFCNNECTNLQYQSLFTVRDPGTDSIMQQAVGVALVGNTFSGTNPYDTLNRPFGVYERYTNHCLMWNNDFSERTFNFYPNNYVPTFMSNWSVRGNNFHQLLIWPDNMDLSLWDSNNFEELAVITTNYTTGSPTLTFATIGTNATRNP